MPTGYTAMIEEDGNTNAREFVRKCAREFMPFIHMREEPPSTPPRLPDEDWAGVSDYSLKSLEESKAKLAEVQGWTQAQAREQYEEYVERAKEYNRESLDDYYRKRGLYEKVLAKLAQWEPDPEAAKLKEFCISQIDMCIPHKAHIMPVDTFDRWLQEELRQAKRRLEWDEEQIKEEQERYKNHRRLAQLFLDETEKVPE